MTFSGSGISECSKRQKSHYSILCSIKGCVSVICGCALLSVLAVLKTVNFQSLQKALQYSCIFALLLPGGGSADVLHISSLYGLINHTSFFTLYTKEGFFRHKFLCHQEDFKTL